ncbi:MAG TPA: GNAT family N-acetyltransferase [Planosporangium sp.]|nr:GNAT family N-acetyltransferase [Planosporangium sp.]
MILQTARFADLDAATLYALLRLRVDVFVVEQKAPYPELDGRDVEPGSVHLWLEHDGTPASYLRILADPGAARIGRVCTATAHRGAGLSARLLAAALDLIGDRPCVLDAQSHLTGFYARFGFEATGPPFVEDGIPHVPMRRTAAQPAYGSAATMSPTDRRRPV